MAGAGLFRMASTEKDRDSLGTILLPTGLDRKSLGYLSKSFSAWMSLMEPSLNFRADSSKRSLQYGVLSSDTALPVLSFREFCMRVWKELSFMESLLPSLLILFRTWLQFWDWELMKLLFGGEKAEHSLPAPWVRVFESGLWGSAEPCSVAARDPSSLAARAASCSGGWLSAGITLGSHTAPGFMFCTAVALKRHCW